MKAKERFGAPPLSAAGANGNHADSCAVRPHAIGWEDWFQHATVAQQGEVLALAQRQGFVFTHQLPVPVNGAKAHAPVSAEANVEVLAAFLAGKTDTASSAAPASCDFADPQLTVAQQCAVRRMLGTPDGALLRRKAAAAAAVVAEFVVQAARAGQRVLFVAQHAGALDQVLQRLQGRDAVLPIRFLDPGESAAQLSAPVRACTLEAQRQLFQTSTLARAQADRAASEECCQRRRTEEPLWPELAALAVRHAALEKKRQDLHPRLDQALADVRREAESTPSGANGVPSGPFALQVIELVKEFERQQEEQGRAEATLKERQSKLHVDLANLRTEQNALQPLLAAKQTGHWWSQSWWRATFTKNLTEHASELEQRGVAIQAGLDEVRLEMERLVEQSRQAVDRLARDRESLILAESERRRQAWTSQLAAIDQEQVPLIHAWKSLTSKLESDHLPEAPTPEAVAAAQLRWHARQENDEAACRFARQWAGFLQEAAPNFVAQLPRYASLLAGTASALARNPEFAAAAEGPFDWIVLDDADRLLENDLLRLARRGRRWLLMGGPTTANGRPSSFDKLWQTLHADPSARLAYRWCKEAERWCCQLRPVSQQERRHLETERLADFPEVELRILSIPKTRPQLAQVVFPASMTLAQATLFIYRELEEAALQPAGRGAWLEDRPNCWTLHLGPPATSELTAIELQPGIRVWAAPNGPTHRLEFDKVLWQRPQVEDWIRQRLNLRDLGRTFELA